MPTQKIFKERVRTRMAKTGESYTAARRQLLQKADGPKAAGPGSPAAATESAIEAELLTSDESMRRGSGRGHREWFALLDAWGATEHTHTEIARWLHETEGVPGWWSQNITVNYERARGMRSPGQMADGFSISVTRTIAVDQDRLFAAITGASTRKRWLPGITLRSRPTRAAWTARYDWPSRRRGSSSRSSRRARASRSWPSRTRSSPMPRRPNDSRPHGVAGSVTSRRFSSSPDRLGYVQGVRAQSSAPRPCVTRSRGARRRGSAPPSPRRCPSR